jgi:hypothetical protein
MAFTDLVSDGVPLARIKQGMGLKLQAEEAGIFVRQNNGNRLETLSSQTRSIVIAYEDTLPNSEALEENVSGVTHPCWWLIPPDVKAGRLYITSDDTGASFVVRCFPDSAEGPSTVSYPFGTTVAMGGASIKQQRIANLEGISAMGLTYTNGTGGDVDLVIKFVYESGYEVVV